MSSSAVGVDGDLDLTGSITLLDADAEGESVAELTLYNEVAVNGFDPVLPPVPQPTAQTCILDSSEIDLSHGSVYDATAGYWVGGAAPPTVSTVQFQAPSGCGEESFAAWDQPGREVDVQIHLAIGPDRVFWGSGFNVTPGNDGEMLFSSSDWLLASSISAENTIPIQGHIEYRGVDGELIALAIIDREISFSG